MTPIKINCPKCGHEFNVEEVITRQIEEQFQVKYKRDISTLESDYKKKEEFLARKELELKQRQNEITKQVEELVKSETQKKEKEIKNNVAKEYENQLRMLNEETIQTKKEIQELKKAKIENEQLKRKLDEQRQNLELEFEQKMTIRINEEAEKITKRESEKVLLPLKEKEILINQLKEQIDNMQRNAEQGSEQLQGEAQELFLEETLQSVFPFDLIEPVGKGIKGADVIQTVRNKIGMDCGKIIYESKRTKTFSEEWIAKLKADAVSIGANVYVIVTQTMPDGMDKIGFKNDVWICSFKDFKGFILVLRESLIKINEAFSSQVNKGDKMQMLYDYLLSNEFMLQITAIVDGFDSLQESYRKERNALERIWKEREHQLKQILLNTNSFIGSIKGIAGSSMANLKQIGKPEIQLRIGNNEPI